MIFEEVECLTCGEECAEWAGEQCPKSKRKCGHHCNCTWTQDVCCWCDKKFEADEDGNNHDEEQT